jgi:hypothetical protein
MRKPMNVRKALVLGTLLPVLYLADDSQPSHSGITLMPLAHAIVGAPLTPVSVAGVARRTTRRAVVATSATTSQQAATAQQQQATAQQQATTAQQQSETAKQQAAVAQQQAAARPRVRRQRAPS